MDNESTSKQIEKSQARISYISSSLRGYQNLNSNIKEVIAYLESAVNEYETLINKVKKVVYASSSSVYGDSEILPKKEGVEGKVLSPYALTKRIDEEYSRLFYKLYGVKSIGLRYFNVFGRRQDPNSQYAAVIPKFVSACLRNETSYINGDGSYSRDFTYIDNVIEANMKALTW